MPTTILNLVPAPFVGDFILQFERVFDLSEQKPSRFSVCRAASVDVVNVVWLVLLVFFFCVCVPFSRQLLWQPKLKPDL